MRSIGTELDKNRGLAPGFDFLRIFLACSVVVWHTAVIASGSKWPDSAPIIWLAGYGILAIFFALSGFLISGSATRLPLGSFLVNRGLRIFPALIVEVVLSAFILGLAFTSLAPMVYLSEGQTWQYLTNIVGLVNYQLPGVFKMNPTSAVNYSLWTIPHELLCYAIMSVFMIVGALRRTWIVGVAFAVSIAAGFWLDAVLQAGVENGLAAKIVSTLMEGSRLYVSFILGIAAYLFRYRLPYSGWLFAMCVAGCAAIAIVGPQPWLTIPVLNVLVPPLGVYICVYIGLSRIPTLPVLRRGDYSYGIYLYGAPIQQSVRALLSSGSGFANLAVSAPLIILFAAFSWHCIEKPVMRLRKKFSFVARVREIEAVEPSATIGSHMPKLSTELAVPRT